MLESLVRFSIKQRIMVWLSLAGLIGGGLYAFSVLPIEAFPDVLNETVQVITQAPGQSAENIEQKITAPLEREFSGIPKVIQVRSVSEFGLSVIYLYFEDGVDKYWARSQTMEKVTTATLPPNIQPSLAPMASVTGEIYRYELHGPGYTSTDLRGIQEWMIEKEFRAVPGVADVTSYGGKLLTWEVLVDPLRLTTYGLSIRQLSDSVSNSNMNAGGNMLNYPNQSFVVRSLGEFKTAGDLGDVGIAQKANSVIRVKDVAQVIKSHANLRGKVGKNEHDDVVQGIVLLRKGENPVLVGEAVQAKLEALNAGTMLPPGVKLVPYYNRTELVQKTTKTVGKNLLEGLILVCLVLYLFLRNKYATGLVALIVPLSLLFALIFMVMTKTPANLISLGAIDFGIVVDGAVIIVEFILARIHQSHRETDDITEEQLGRMIIQIVKPIAVSMMIIILAYLPIFTLQRVEGKMFSPLAWTISFTLMGALLLSLTVVPSLLPWMLHKSKSLNHEEPPFLVKLQKRYERGLDWVFRKKRKFIGIVAAGVAVGIVIFMSMGSEFLPELDEGALWIRASFPHSTSIEEGSKLAHKIREKLKADEEVRTVVSQLGGPEDGTDPNLTDNCEFFVDLKPHESWKRFSNREDFVNFVRDQLSEFIGVDFNVSQPIADNVEEAISGVKGKNAAKIFGPDLAELDHLADKYSDMIHSVQGTADVGKIATTPMVPHVTVRVDRAKVAQAGLSTQDINDWIEIAVGGKVVTQVYENERRIDVIVRAPERYRESLQAIRELPIQLPNGQKTQLDRLADVKLENAPQAIFRENGYRRIGVKFNVEGRDLGSVMKEIQEKERTTMKVPPGYHVEWGGEYENQSRAMRRFMVVLPATIVLIALVLFLLFQNIQVVTANILTLLISIVGSVVFLFIRQIPFSVSGAVGFLVLFGVITLNNVALTSSYLRLRQSGKDMMSAIHRACHEQFRPLLMTSVLAALGLLPAAISHSMGSETQRPLATAVIGGVFTGLPSVLFVLPFLLMVMEYIKIGRINFKSVVAELNLGVKYFYENRGGLKKLFGKK